MIIQRAFFPLTVEAIQPQLRHRLALLREHPLHERSLGLLQSLVLLGVLVDGIVEVGEDSADGLLFFESGREINSLIEQLSLRDTFDGATLQLVSESLHTPLNSKSDVFRVTGKV